MRIIVKSYSEKPIIKEIPIFYPTVIFTDSHCNVNSIKTLRNLYPRDELISLGDFTFLFEKPDEEWNNKSIQYFIDNKIPTLIGNHESFVGGNIGFNITIEQKEYLNKLPMGFKLVLPSGKYYLAFHNRPLDLWGFEEEKGLELDEFKRIYEPSSNCIGILKGHYHFNRIINYTEINSKLINIGRLSKDGDYALINENGVEFKRL